MAKTILVTGGAGFIGSHLCRKYLDEGHRVICIDNLQTTRTAKNIEPFLKNRNFRFIKQDIIEPIDFSEKIDWIFNFACSGSYTSYQFDPIHTMKTNTIGVINVLELAKKCGARIMQASTSEIYGDPLETPQKENYNGNVNILGPRACYDEGKRAAETLFMDYHREYGVDSKIIRIFNTYGPFMDVNDGRAITNFIINALSGRDMVIYGDGSQTRSFQYIDDLLSAIDLMMKKDNFSGPVNLGNPEEKTISDIAQAIIKTINSKSKIIFQVKASDDPKRRCPDISLAKKELNWEPKISLEDGLKKTIAYFERIERPDSKILIFATTYYPDLGPAEQPIFELAKMMPDTEFHVITTKLRPNLPSFDRIENTFIYRVGLGMKIDKFLLPILGTIKACFLNKKYSYRFVWSVMASYGGLPAVLLKTLKRDINFLLMVDKSETADRNFIKGRIILPFYKIIFKKADSVYFSDVSMEKDIKELTPDLNFFATPEDNKEFMHQVREEYIRLINKQDKKLVRPK